MKIIKSGVKITPVKTNKQEHLKVDNLNPWGVNKKRRVVCMEDLRGIDSGVFEIESDAIITPLAKDYLKDKGITVIYR